MDNWDKDADAAAHIALDISTECRKLMGNLLELPAEKLHCCIKVIVPKTNDSEEDKVATWVRSRPVDDRPVETGEDNAHLVSKNSVWSALYGRSDQRTNWRPFSCFACNDLMSHADIFVCDRENWPWYYKSTLVFPLRYPKNQLGTELKEHGLPGV